MLKTLIKLPKRYIRHLDSDLHFTQTKTLNPIQYFTKEQHLTYWITTKTPLLDLEQYFKQKQKKTNNDQIFTANFDGASKGNPGRSSCGFLIKNDKNKIILKDGFFLGHKTNNFAEYMGLIYLMIFARGIGIRKIKVFSDSELLVKQMKFVYKVRDSKLKWLFGKAKDLEKGFEWVEYGHVRREFNTEADKLCNDVFK